MARKGEKTSEETRAKMSAAHRARLAQNPEAYRQVCNFIHIGRKRSAETRAKMSAAHTGRQLSEETKAKISWAVASAKREVA